MRRPTHRDIARIAGVSHVAVSMALRGHRSIPKVTQERIQEIAKKIGYRPDPALQALMVYRRGAKPSSYQGTLAWINNYQQDPNKLRLEFGTYFAGAQERCAELGYKLEEFRLVDFGLSFKRLSKVLHARNIQGLLFPPQGRQRHVTRASFDWENFSMVAFGFSLMRPRLDVVTNAMFRSTRLAMRKLRSLGYRRIGFVSDQRFSVRTDHNFMAGYLIEQRRFLTSERLPIHLITGRTESEHRKNFLKWFSRHTPEVVLAVSGRSYEWLCEMRPAERNGCAVAGLDVPHDNTDFSGINQNNWIIGRVAIDTLIAKIHANERGIPETPRRIYIEGRWVDGKTAPRIT